MSRSIEDEYRRLGGEKVASLWAYHQQSKRQVKAGGRNGGRKPKCNRCGLSICRYCKSHGLA